MAKIDNTLPPITTNTGGGTSIHNDLSGLNVGNYIHLTVLEKTKFNNLPNTFAPVDAEKNVNTDWNAISGDEELLNKPSTFPPSAHTHIEADIVDLDKYTQLEVDNFLGDKVDKVTGKSLIDDTEITRLALVTNFDNSGNINALGNKVDKIVGKGLSTEDYTTAEKSKLSGIEAGAEVNNILDTNATDLTDGGDTTLHHHDSRYYTEIEVDGFLDDKFDIPTGNNTQYLDGSGTPTPFPTIPTGLGDLAYLAEVGTNEIENHAVTNTKLAQMNTNTVKGRLAGNGTPQDVPMSSLPISTATQNALDLKQDNLGFTPANKAGDTFTGDISAPNLSGTNTGDETTSSIQTKRPLKTINGNSLEGTGDIAIDGGVTQTYVENNFISKNYRKNYRFFTDFLTPNSSELAVTSSGTGSTAPSISTVDRLGILLSQTGTTATGRNSAVSTTNIVIFGGISFTYEAMVMIPTLSDATNRFQLILGFF